MNKPNIYLIIALVLMSLTCSVLGIMQNYQYRIDAERNALAALRQTAVNIAVGYQNKLQLNIDDLQINRPVGFEEKVMVLRKKFNDINAAINGGEGTSKILFNLVKEYQDGTAPK